MVAVIPSGGFKALRCGNLADREGGALDHFDRGVRLVQERCDDLDLGLGLGISAIDDAQLGLATGHKGERSVDIFALRNVVLDGSPQAELVERRLCICLPAPL